MIAQKMYSVKDIMEILNISKTSTYKLLKEKCFPCVKFGRIYRISKEGFDKWLQLK